MDPNQRTMLFMNLREHLKTAGLQFFERPQERQLLLMMRTDEMTFVQVVTVRKDGASLRVETKLPLVVPEHRRIAAAEMVTRLNRLTERGFYDLDLDSGDLVFRIDAHALGSVLMPGLLVRLLSMALQPVVRDWPVVEGVLRREEDTRAAIAGNAERVARLHEAQQRAEAAERRRRDLPKRADGTGTDGSVQGSPAEPGETDKPAKPKRKPRRPASDNAKREQRVREWFRKMGFDSDDEAPPARGAGDAGPSDAGPADAGSGGAGPRDTGPRDARHEPGAGGSGSPDGEDRGGGHGGGGLNGGAPSGGGPPTEPAN